MAQEDIIDFFVVHSDQLFCSKDLALFFGLTESSICQSLKKLRRDRRVDFTCFSVVKCNGVLYDVPFYQLSGVFV